MTARAKLLSRLAEGERKGEPPPIRGILRLYVLRKLSQQPQSGYDLMSTLSAATEGSWRPGPGSIYPILRDLEENGFIKDHAKKGKSRRVYRLTEKGCEELESARQQFDEYGKHGWRKMRGLMLEIMSPKAMAERIMEGTKWQQTLLERVLSSNEIGERDKAFLLKEYKLFLERQLDWVNDKLLSPQKV